MDGARAGAETNTRPVAGTAGPPAEGDGSAVEQEGAHGAVGQRQRALTAPRQLDEAALGTRFGAAHGAAAEEVTGPDARAVRGEVGELLGEGPVHVAETRRAHRGAVEV